MGGCCLLALASFISPRLAMIFMWLFTDRLALAFDSFLAATVGFVLLPWTSVIYALVYSPATKVSWLGWAFVAFGLFLDLSSWFGGGNKGREYYVGQYRTVR